MNLSVCNTTLREVAGEASCFPNHLRTLICDAVAVISLTEMEAMLGKHESDPENFDGQIEQNLRLANQSVELKANHPISTQTKFNNALGIEINGNLVCLEIEKGQFSRFEFDILKMQAFATRWRRERSEAKIFGAFVVPADNIVGRHISGNARESSYRYLRRLFRLVVQIEPLLLDDVLLIGYGASVPREKHMQQRPQKTKVSQKLSDNVVKCDRGLLPKEMLWDAMSSYPLELVMKLRDRLNAKCVGLREKLNRNSRCLGYVTDGRSDALYVYVQKKRLLLDVRVSDDRVEELRGKGFEVRPRDNFQAKSGWLTGLLVPHDTDNLDQIVELAIEALQG